MANELGVFLEKLRGKMSLRIAAEKSGLSHAYIRDLELGVNRATKTVIRPTPETLQKLATAYNYPYEDLMRLAGYMDANDEEVNDDDTIKLIKEVAQKFGLSPSDPLFKKALSDALNLLAFTRQQNDK